MTQTLLEYIRTAVPIDTTLNDCVDAQLEPDPVKENWQRLFDNQP